MWLLQSLESRPDRPVTPYVSNAAEWICSGSRAHGGKESCAWDITPWNAATWHVHPTAQLPSQCLYTNGHLDQHLQRGRSRGGRGGNGPPTFIVLGAEPPHFSSMYAYSHMQSTQLCAHWIYFLLCMGEFVPSLYLLLLPL